MPQDPMIKVAPGRRMVLSFKNVRSAGMQSCILTTENSTCTQDTGWHSAKQQPDPIV